MSNLEHFIECPKLGGKRPAPACIHYDRYRSCRRKCKSLEAYVKANPNYKEVVEEHYNKNKDGSFIEATLFASLPSKQSGKNIPDFDLACHLCSFTGKSKRGLCIHLRRTHKVFKVKNKK